jgi:hypothetical protein
MCRRVTRVSGWRSARRAALGGGTDTAPVRRIASLDAPTPDAALHALAPDRTWIVDKLSDNYLYLGLVGLLPGAQIIHCVRDPRDIGLAIYAYWFHGSHGYAHDLGDLGGTIARSDRPMAHWRQVLPNPILTVRPGCRLLQQRAMPHGGAISWSMIPTGTNSAVRGRCDFGSGPVDGSPTDRRRWVEVGPCHFLD